MSTHPLPTPEDFIEALDRLDGNLSQTAKHYRVDRGTVRRWREGILDDLELTGVSVNPAGGISHRYKPAPPTTAPIVIREAKGWKAPRRPKINTKKPRTWALFSDIHAPFHDQGLIAAACAWLADETPTDGIINGDLLDFPDISRFDDDDGYVAAVNDCLDTASDVLRSFVDASPDTRWILHPGNHEDRLPRYIKKQAPRLWGIRPAHAPDGQEWHSLAHLLQLDTLGIKLHPASYPDAETAITPKYVVTHGDHVRAKSGNSAHAALDKADHSFAQGHDHRLAQVFKTKWGADGRPSIHVGVQTGCMADVTVRGLGYAKKPDWQPGFAVVHAYPDGLFHSQLAVWVNDTLLIGGKRYG